MILPATQPADLAQGEDGSAPAAPTGPPLSKSQQRKLRKVQEEKERRDKRAEVLASLSKHQMTGDQLGLLRSVSSLGHKDSKKEALRRALQLQRAGIDVPSDVQLFKERKTPREAEEDGGSASSEEEEDANVGRSFGVFKSESKAKGVLAQKKATAGRSQDDSESSDESDMGTSEDDDEEEDDAAPSAKRLKKNNDAAEKAADAAATKAQLRHAVNQAKTELEEVLMKDDDDEEEEGLDTLRKKVPLDSQTPSGPPRVVLVQRTAEIEAVRTNLPIVGMEQEIMEAISENDVLVLCGETGCGKTTQVPQFLYEAGYGSTIFPERAGAIGVTQPRRVAAVSTAGRVAEELGSKLGDLVGYQVSYYYFF